MRGDGAQGEALGGVAGHAGTIAGATIGGTIGFLADKLSIPSGVGLGALGGAQRNIIKMSQESQNTCKNLSFLVFSQCSKSNI